MLVLGQDGCLFWDKMDFCPGTRWIFVFPVTMLPDTSSVGWTVFPVIYLEFFVM